MPSFAYTPLDLKRSEFRLVRLKKGRACEIDCELVHATLDDNFIPYEAVSYTWGSLLKPYTINIQGATLNVTYHLWRVLHDLQQAETDRYLWIDAISIDQKNIAERGHQVQRMKEIYTSADRVLFCLGGVSNHSINVFMASVKGLQRKVRGFRGSDESRCKDAWGEVQRMLRLRYGNEYEQLQREGLQHVLRQKWFRRVWILQEAASAQKALVYYNADSVSLYVTRAYIIGLGTSV
ncbi:HET-domain-containing protein [Nemania sp. FL0031]|nr:HET-domain-containing protein [Nemania sp. FL0031]